MQKLGSSYHSVAHRVNIFIASVGSVRAVWIIAT
jgi:hypothetical protein